MEDEVENAECNYEAAGTWDDDEDNEEEANDFEIAEVDPAERTTLNTSVEYIRRWVGRSKLHVLQNGAVHGPLYDSDADHTH